MLVIGSQALKHHGIDTGRVSLDIDFICTLGEYENYKASILEANVIIDEPNKKVIDTGTIKLEFDIAQDGDTNSSLLFQYPEGELTYAKPELVYILKMTHRFKKNSPHFHKTMHDINLLRDLGYGNIHPSWWPWIEDREKETYDYALPKLNQSKDNFFDTDGVEYTYDHDSIHKAIKMMDKPAYEYFKPEENDVFCSKELWDKCPEEVKLNAVMEESGVLALERSLVPYEFGCAGHQREVFSYALMKVCTSITSGWFRDYAWEHYKEVMDAWDDKFYNFVDKFQEGLESGVVVPHKPQLMEN